jgi:hypothetical protein
MVNQVPILLRNYDFGTLETEKVNGWPGYNGFKLQDQLDSY